MSDHSVFVIDDDSAVRDALLRVLRGRGVRARGFSSGTEFFAALPEDASACVITDVQMPGMDGTEIVRRLAELRGETWPVIVITGHADVSMAVQMMKNGIVDFIEKPFHNEDLLSRITRALEVDSQIAARQQRNSAVAHRLELLTQREREVMLLVVAGKLNKQVADELNISMKTVEAHRARVMEKMGVRTLAELVKAVMSVS